MGSAHGHAGGSPEHGGTMPTQFPPAPLLLVVPCGPGEIAHQG